MLTAHIAALGAALCWAAGGLIAIGPVRAIGSLAFNRLRLAIVGAGLVVAASIMGVWHTLEAEAALRLAASALAGIVMGDLALFWSLSRLGPRRNVVIYATNAPLTALLGWLVLGETLGPTTILGIGFVTMGVMLAVALRSGNGHSWEAVQGSLLAGVTVCLVAALGQAAGSIIAKPAMVTGVHPIAAAAVRTVTAAVAMLVLGLLFRDRMAAGGGLTPRIALLTAVNGFIGVGMGATLIMVALSYGNAGVVATLSALSPVLILPMLWALTRQRPGFGAWAGAAIAVAGVGLIVNR